MSKNSVTYPDLEKELPNGQKLYYNLTMAGDDLSKPTTFVLSRSSLAPDQPVASLDRHVIMGLAKELDKKPNQIAIYSERDHDKFDLVRLEERGRDPETREPLYAERRDHGSLFEKEYVEKDVNKYEERAKRKELFEISENQRKEFSVARISSPDEISKEELKELQEREEERER